jgi:tetratricopeptide (TPR) repeat protein
MVLGDAQSQCMALFDKANKELDVQNYAKSLAYFSEANTIAEDNNLVYTKMSALFNLAVVYMKISDYRNAMEHYLEAYQIAVKNPHKKYKTLEIEILNNISVLYSDSRDFDKSKEYLYKAYQCALQLQDSARIGVCAINLVSYANKTGDLEEAEHYLNVIVTMFQSLTIDSSWLLFAKAVKMENLYLKKEYDNAEQLSLEILAQNTEILDNNAKAETLLYLSRIYQQKKKHPKALEAAKEAMSVCQKLSILFDINEHLANLYLELGEPYLAIQYLHSMMAVKDSLHKKTDLINVMIRQVQSDLTKMEKAYTESKIKQQKERTLFVVIMAFVVLSIVILVWIFRMRTVKSKQLKMIAELESEKQAKEKQLMEQQLKDQERLSLMEQQRLNNEIELKNRQLAAKILFQSNRDELMKEIFQVLTKIPGSQSKEPMLKSVIQKLRTEIKESAKDKNSFLVYFEQINTSFLSILKAKHPDLTADEIRLLSYIYLNLDAKEISKLFNITYEYYRKKKQRLSKKMNISTAEIYRYLASMS